MGTLCMRTKMKVVLKQVGFWYIACKGYIFPTEVKSWELMHRLTPKLLDWWKLHCCWIETTKKVKKLHLKITWLTRVGLTFSCQIQWHLLSYFMKNKTWVRIIIIVAESSWQIHNLSTTRAIEHIREGGYMVHLKIIDIWMDIGTWMYRWTKLWTQYCTTYPDVKPLLRAPMIGISSILLKSRLSYNWGQVE